MESHRAIHVRASPSYGYWTVFRLVNLTQPAIGQNLDERRIDEYVGLGIDVVVEQ